MRLLLAIAALAAGCATTLLPAPEASRAPGPGDAAEGAAADVHVIVSSNAWRGQPEDLADLVTPMRFTVTNTGERQLELRYEHFALLSPGGALFIALPPFQITDAPHESIEGLYPSAGFDVAPYLAPWYHDRPVYGGTFPDRAAHTGGFQRGNLPSDDMLRKALPEGVLRPFGRITGFLYFEPVVNVRRVAFVMNLVDASTGERFGTIEVPFVVGRKGEAHRPSGFTYDALMRTSRACGPA